MLLQVTQPLSKKIFSGRGISLAYSKTKLPAYESTLAVVHRLEMYWIPVSMQNNDQFLDCNT